MSGTYQQNKNSIYNWNLKNREKKLEYDRVYKRRCKMWKDISQKFRLILLEDLMQNI